LVAVAVGVSWRVLVSFPFKSYGYAFDVAPAGVSLDPLVSLGIANLRPVFAKAMTVARRRIFSHLLANSW